MTPEEWRTRLLKRLRDEQVPAVEAYESWYDGNHLLPQATAKNSELYDQFRQMSISNFLAVVVNAICDRLSVQGVILGGEEADAEAWEVWQRSGFDSIQGLVYQTALVSGMSYISVWPDADGYPRLAPEHPAEVIHERTPGTLRDVSAALKLYEDDVNEVWITTLYLPDSVYEWSSPSKSLNTFELTREFVNPFGRVPMIPVLNNLDLRGRCASEIRDAVPIQRRINQSLLNLMVAQESVAFPQRWATGLSIPKDEDGNDVRPFKSGADQLWVSEDETVKFGQFMESQFGGYLNTIQADIEQMASTTQTPLFTLSANLANPPSAEALSAMESPLVKKAESKQRLFGEALEDAIRLAMFMIDPSRGDMASAQLIWEDPRTLSEAARVDAAVKLKDVGVPASVIWERVGATPQEVERWRSLAMSDALQQLIIQVGQNGGPNNPQQQPPQDEEEPVDANA